MFNDLKTAGHTIGETRNDISDGKVIPAAKRRVTCRFKPYSQPSTPDREEQLVVSLLQAHRKMKGIRAIRITTVHDSGCIEHPMPGCSYDNRLINF